MKMPRWLSLVVMLHVLGCGNEHESGTFESVDLPTDFDTTSSPVPAPEVSLLEHPVPVVHTIDGDTFDVVIDGIQERIRMKGINAPELHSGKNHDGPAEPFAEDARVYLLEHIGNQVDLMFDSDCSSNPYQDCRDVYGRLLAYVRLSDGSDLGSLLLGQGYARVYVFKNEHFDKRDAYTTLQSTAKAHQLGIWSR